MKTVPQDFNFVFVYVSTMGTFLPSNYIFKLYIKPIIEHLQILISLTPFLKQHSGREALMP